MCFVDRQGTFLLSGINRNKRILSATNNDIFLILASVLKYFVLMAQKLKEYARSFLLPLVNASDGHFFFLGKTTIMEQDI